MVPESTYFRKGFGLKTEVQDTLTSDYDGQLIDLNHVLLGHLKIKRTLKMTNNLK